MRSFRLAFLLSLVLLLPACGNVFVRARWNGGNQTASGVVSIVQLTVVVDGNVSTQVTIVTLVDNLGTSNFSFCGDQRNQFPPDRFAQARLRRASPARSWSTSSSGFEAQHPGYSGDDIPPRDAQPAPLIRYHGQIWLNIS